MTSHSVVADEGRRFDVALNITVRILTVVAMGLIIALLVVGGEPIIHGHPAYWAVLGVTLVVAVVALIRTFLPRRHNSTLRRIARSLLIIGAISWLAIVGWLLPAGATSIGLEAMSSTDHVTVIEDATQISLVPTTQTLPTGVVFQPGARVDARAYVATLLPLADAGHVVVIAKQPLGVGFLAFDAIGSARSSFPAVTQWVVGGHSLGGTAAAAQVLSERSSTASAPVVGLFFYASYPATSLRDIGLPVLSISGEKDGLSTPQAIADSVANLPADATFVEVPGATHAYFGDYGLQAGDGTATVDKKTATQAIATATLNWLNQRS